MMNATTISSGLHVHGATSSNDEMVMWAIWDDYAISRKYILWKFHVIQMLPGFIYLLKAKAN